ncbi:50S ribosomal protein L21 [Candidatus Campbellbacteria bacterium]|nr:MAG: 50S ribosomal protein L21 [Candidatus Campbellbacteria bacterium]
MTFAVIETGGKQYLVSDDKSIVTEKLPIEAGEKVVFDKVVLMDDGSTTTLGAPYIVGAKIEATLDAQGRGKKIEVIKYKAKSRYYKKRGHRQPFSKVTIKKV